MWRQLSFSFLRPWAHVNWCHFMNTQRISMDILFKKWRCYCDSDRKNNITLMRYSFGCVIACVCVFKERTDSFLCWAKCNVNYLLCGTIITEYLTVTVMFACVLWLRHSWLIFASSSFTPFSLFLLQEDWAWVEILSNISSERLSKADCMAFQQMIHDRIECEAESASTWVHHNRHTAIKFEYWSTHSALPNWMQNQRHRQLKYLFYSNFKIFFFCFCFCLFKLFNGKIEQTGRIQPSFT